MWKVSVDRGRGQGGVEGRDKKGGRDGFGEGSVKFWLILVGYT